MALFGAGAARRHSAALITAASAAPAKPLLHRASLALKLVASTLCFALCSFAKAYAAERLKSAPAAAAGAPFVVTGDMLKWGGLAAVFGAAYIFRREEVPILTETVPDEPAAPVKAAESTEAGDAPAELDMMADLRKRMQELAEERAKAEAEENTPDDSGDEWGTGNTAVLEPPKPDSPQPPSGLLEDGPAVDFPVGFPLRDGDITPVQPEEPEAPLASEEEIAMLERMFGTRGNDA